VGLLVIIVFGCSVCENVKKFIPFVLKKQGLFFKENKFSEGKYNNLLEY
jgi:hypothetical protein